MKRGNPYETVLHRLHLARIVYARRREQNINAPMRPSRQRKRRCREVERAWTPKEAAIPHKLSHRDALEDEVAKLDPGIRSYFDTVPDVLENTVRYLSTKPDAMDWPKFLDARAMSVFYEVDGALGDFMRSRFDSVRVAKSIDNEDEAFGNAINIQNQAVAFSILVERSHNFKEICLGHGFQGHFHLHHVLGVISEKCPNIESFKLPAKAIAPWKSFGYRVKKLEMYCEKKFSTASSNSKKIVKAISTNCSNVRHLILKDIAASHVQGTDLWNNMSNTLEILSVEFSYPAKR